MRVLFKKRAAGPLGNFGVGDIADLDETVAKLLVAAGAVEVVFDGGIPGVSADEVAETADSESALARELAVNPLVPGKPVRKGKVKK